MGQRTRRKIWITGFSNKRSAGTASKRSARRVISRSREVYASCSGEYSKAMLPTQTVEPERRSSPLSSDYSVEFVEYFGNCWKPVCWLFRDDGFAINTTRKYLSASWKLPVLYLLLICAKVTKESLEILVDDEQDITASKAAVEFLLQGNLMLQVYLNSPPTDFIFMEGIYILCRNCTILCICGSLTLDGDQSVQLLRDVGNLWKITRLPPIFSFYPLFTVKYTFRTVCLWMHSLFWRLLYFWTDAFVGNKIASANSTVAISLLQVLGSAIAGSTVSEIINLISLSYWLNSIMFQRNGRFLCTPATFDLICVVLEDESACIEVQELSVQLFSLVILQLRKSNPEEVSLTFQSVDSLPRENVILYCKKLCFTASSGDVVNNRENVGTFATKNGAWRQRKGCLTVSWLVYFPTWGLG